MNDSNLIPNSERSPSELREMGRKGGIKSGEARRKKKELRQQLKVFMEVSDKLRTRDEDRANPGSVNEARGKPGVLDKAWENLEFLARYLKK